MNTRALSLLALVLVLVLAACASDDASSASTDAGGDGTVEVTTDPFSFVPTVGNAASFFTITNTGDVDDVLRSASSDAFGTVELHDTIIEDGSAQMVEQEDGIPIPAGGEVVLEPGGLHVMLLGAEDELVAGDEITIVLEFEQAGEVVITSTVRERGDGDPQPMQMDDMEEMDDAGMDEGGMDGTEMEAAPSEG